MFTADGAASEPIEIFKFPEEVIEAAEGAGMPLPFAVVGSRDTDEVEGEEVPLRHYPWGTCLPLRKEHSDAVFFRYASSAQPAMSCHTSGSEQGNHALMHSCTSRTKDVNEHLQCGLVLLTELWLSSRHCHSVSDAKDRLLALFCCTYLSSA